MGSLVPVRVRLAPSARYPRGPLPNMLNPRMPFDAVACAQATPPISPVGSYINVATETTLRNVSEKILAADDAPRANR